MKNIRHLLKRTILGLLLSAFLILILDILLYVIVFYGIIRSDTVPISPSTVLSQTSQNLKEEENSYKLSTSFENNLKQCHAWAMLVDHISGKVLWGYALPSDVETSYTIADAAQFTQGYLNGYPVFCTKYHDDLLVEGYPRGTYSNNLRAIPVNAIRIIPGFAVTILLLDLLLIGVIYFWVSRKTIFFIDPLVEGVQALSEGKPVQLKESGTLGPVSKSINETSCALQEKNAQIKRKDQARTNWIAGVSHDIRTPLSLVMGYSEQLEQDDALSTENRTKASIIRMQSIRIRNLISDLNLISKLEYDMQPIHMQAIRAVTVLRQAAVDFLNSSVDKNYPIHWDMDKQADDLIIRADAGLLVRAVSNLIQNSQLHNPNGCAIFLRLEKQGDVCKIAVGDDGVGAQPDQLKQLQNTPHYMMSEDSNGEQRHGLGLLIVQKIVKAHHGQFEIDSTPGHGFRNVLSLPLIQPDRKQYE
ncbi:sensor histidine kinase [Caproiciproducens sp. NJN-50]|uniref:sensor histidine kinase n=2 Tax=Acutalibacteraceae TaxID=3082771 RepID=UPI0013E8D90C|nr:HAMP domain-containing sensor histidine kinase [Caproiciproducens sp. NJN-50]